MDIATATPMPDLAPDVVLALFGMPGGMEWIVLLVLGLLIFGRRLPEVGRSIGKSIVEFKRGIKGIEDDINHESSRSDRDLADSSHADPSLPEAGIGSSKVERVPEGSRAETD